MLKCLLLLACASVPSFGAEAEGWSLWRSMGFSSPRQNMGRQRSLVFARHGLDEKFIITQCLKNGSWAECPPEFHESMVAKVAQSLDQLPPGLRTTKIPMVQWSEQRPGERSTGSMDPSFGISLRTAKDDPAFDGILLHEAAHMYDEQNQDKVTAYHKLRLSTPRMRQDAQRFFNHVRDTNPGIERWSQAKLDEEGMRMLAELKVPRRNDKDFTALMDGYEYWAVSVELYHKHRGDAQTLQKYFSKEEAAFLERFYRR